MYYRRTERSPAAASEACGRPDRARIVAKGRHRRRHRHRHRHRHPQSDRQADGQTDGEKGVGGRGSARVLAEDERRELSAVGRRSTSCCGRGRERMLGWRSGRRPHSQQPAGHRTQSVCHCQPPCHCQSLSLVRPSCASRAPTRAVTYLHDRLAPGDVRCAMADGMGWVGCTGSVHYSNSLMPTASLSMTCHQTPARAQAPRRSAARPTALKTLHRSGMTPTPTPTTHLPPRSSRRPGLSLGQRGRTSACTSGTQPLSRPGKAVLCATAGRAL